MTGFDVFNAIGTTATIIGVINALKDKKNSIASDMFKESFIAGVKQNAFDFADFTDPERVDMDDAPLVPF